MIGCTNERNGKGIWEKRQKGLKAKTKKDKDMKKKSFCVEFK
jgi:hypothetical protein